VLKSSKYVVVVENRLNKDFSPILDADRFTKFNIFSQKPPQLQYATLRVVYEKVVNFPDLPLKPNYG
jgi:hypothetical protein